jgi:hypothetical protein
MPLHRVTSTRPRVVRAIPDHRRVGGSGETVGLTIERVADALVINGGLAPFQLERLRNSVKRRLHDPGCRDLTKLPELPHGALP